MKAVTTEGTDSLGSHLVDQDHIIEVQVNEVANNFIRQCKEILIEALNKMKASIKANRGLCLALLIYVTVLSTVTILKYYTFLVSFYDLGIYNQAFWTTLFEGKLFYETGDLSFNPKGSFFGTHFSPILFLLLPFYAIYPSCENLLVMQTIVLAIGAVPIYWMARDRLGGKYAIYISILYLIYPPLIALNLNDFHLEAFTSTFLLFAIYYLKREEWAKFFLFTFLAMATLEFVPLIVLFIAMYGILLHSRKKPGDREKGLRNLSLTALMAVFWFILALKSKEFFNPYTSAIPSPWHQALFEPANIPQVFLENLSSKLFYIICFLAPLAFAPLLALKPLIMTIPWFGASFISQWPGHYSAYYHYNGFVIPFIFIALIEGIKRMAPKGVNSEFMKKLLTMMFLSTALFGMYFSIAPYTPWMYQLPVPTERTQLLHDVLALVPSNASILTQNDVGSHISSRSNAYVSIPTSLLNDVSVDYILIDLNSLWSKWRPDFPSKVIPPIEFAMKMLESGEHGIFASAKGILLLKRGYTGDPVFFMPYVAEYNYRSLIVANGRIIEDETATSDKVLYRGADDKPCVFWRGPYVDLVPGLYKATFVLKTNAMFRPEDHMLTLDVTASAGRVMLAKKYIYGVHVPFRGQWFNVTVLFGLKTINEGVEFRGFAHGNHSLFLDRIIVRQLSPLPSSSMELAFSTKELRATKVATLYDDVITHLEGIGTLWYGPYAILPKGNYVVTFWLRLDTLYDGDLIDIDVAIDAGKTILARTTVSSFNFMGTNAWQPFNLTFSLSEDAKDIEFRGMNVREGAPISLLLIEVKPKV